MEARTTTATLSEPTLELATRLLEEVEFEKRLVGLKMAAMGGSNPTSLHSLAEVADFIKIGDYEAALRDNHTTVGYIDPSALARWVAEVLGDEELADAIRTQAAEGDFYGKVAGPIKALLVERVVQCRHVLKPIEAELDA